MSVIGVPEPRGSRRFHVMTKLDETRWAVVQRRDTRYDGVFIYAVSTTGVACRPGCAARTPRRDHVEFFATLADAERAGYRACRRCRPDQGRVVDASLEAVTRLCRRLEQEGAVDVVAFAAEVGYSERHLRRRFAEVIGVPVAAYARNVRARRAREILPSSPAVTEAVYAAGFGSSRAFYGHGARSLGMAPQRYRGGADAEHIRYTTLVTPLGHVIVATTARGVCAVRLGDDEAALERELAEEFPRARRERDDAGLGPLASVLALAVRGEGEVASLPLDVQGTAFQVRVWETLRRVPRGATISYAELATLAGAPRAARAVGSACAANPVAVAIPCHRVVRGDGSLGGYRWGLDAKAALLRAEGATATA